MNENQQRVELIRLRTEVLQLRANLFDPSTHLPTLPVVLDQVRRLLDRRGFLQVFLISLEQEKNLEQVVGWENYDHLLRWLADHLRGLIGEGLGVDSLLCQESVRGDAFVVFCADSQAGVRLLGNRDEGLSVPNEDGDGWVNVSIRTGKGTIRRHATQRLERCIYGGVLEARRDYDRQGAELDEGRRTEVLSMLKDRSVQTLFQPVLKLGEREIVGYEALSRGPAGSYLESAENLFGFTDRVGLLGEVELLCLERALENAKAIDDGSDLFLNLSIQGLEFVENTTGGLAEFVKKARRDPRRVVLEITERTYAENPDLLRTRVEKLRKDGFRIAIDDMGTGYSSLHVVADLRPDFIKLDQMLVRDIATSPIKQNMVSAVIRFAKESKSQVIAEGVEQEAEAEVLAKLGIDLVQGFFFGLPKPGH